MSNDHQTQRQEIQEYIKLTRQLHSLENKIDLLEQFCLKKIDGGNFYLSQSIQLEVDNQNIVVNTVPSYCMKFSLSSTTSKAFHHLKKPYQNIGLQLLDKQGRRKSAIIQKQILNQ